MAAWQVNPAVTSLLVDGIIAGVGILTFLPNIFILFLALAFLEDSGCNGKSGLCYGRHYGRIGWLSYCAFIPMILDLGCSVPAVMASRALEDNKDRMKTMLVTPLCHAAQGFQFTFCFRRCFWEKCNDSSLLNVCHWVSCCCFCCFYSSYCR